MGDQTLNFTPTKNADGSVSWMLCIKNGKCGNGTDPFPPVNIPKGKPDVTFEVAIVNDNTGMGIKFAPDPLWVQQNTKPIAPVLDTQIYGVSNGGTTLSFTDANCNHGDTLLKYRLNFVDSQGKAVNPVDPDIHNGGSSVMAPPPPSNAAGYSAAQVTVALVIAFVVGFAIAAVIFRKRAK